MTLQVLSQMRRLNVQYSPRQQARYLSLLVLRVQELPMLNHVPREGRTEAFACLDFDYRASLIVKYGLPAISGSLEPLFVLSLDKSGFRYLYLNNTFDY